jgi:hypothetical protein
LVYSPYYKEMRATRSWLWALATAVGVLLVACAASGAPTPGVPSTATAVTGAGSAANGDAQAAVDAALSDAASHLGVSTRDLQVVRVEARQWGDSSLGCPKPGLMYSQIVTPGYLIVISGAGKQLEYHSDTRGRVVLCQES